MEEGHRKFTKKLDFHGIALKCSKRINILNVYSVQRRNDRDILLFMQKASLTDCEYIGLLSDVENLLSSLYIWKILYMVGNLVNHRKVFLTKNFNDQCFTTAHDVKMFYLSISKPVQIFIISLILLKWNSKQWVSITCPRWSKRREIAVKRRNITFCWNACVHGLKNYRFNCYEFNFCIYC